MAAKGKKSSNSKSKLKIEVFVAVILILALGQATRLVNHGRNDGSSQHVPPSWLIVLLQLSLPASISLYGVRKGSLDITGGILALFIGAVHSIASCTTAFSLIAFFILGSRASKWKLDIKQQFESVEDSGPRRNWKQVFCNGIVSSVACIVYLLTDNRFKKCSALLVSLSSLSCCCGDTLASEIGSIMGGANPRLITTFQRVPRGTNGGVSIAGTLASVLGGLFIGMVYYITQLWTLSYINIPPTLIIITGLFGGLFGSLLDSLLGATLQYSGYDLKSGKISHTPQSNYRHISGRDILTNNTVNLLSSLLTGLAVPYLLLYIFH